MIYINNLNFLIDKLVERLGIEKVPFVFLDIEDDSILDFSDKIKIVINKKYENNFLETIKCITHEYRHIFQMFWSKMMNDEYAVLWKNELKRYEKSNNNYKTYLTQMIEIDAFAFTKVFIEENTLYSITFDNKEFEKIIDLYIKNNKAML